MHNELLIMVNATLSIDAAAARCEGQVLVLDVLWTIGWGHDGYETQMDVKDNLISYSGIERWNRSGLAR